MSYTDTLGVQSIAQIYDRLSMELYFTHIYTTTGKRASLKTIVLISKIDPESIEIVAKRKSKLDDFTINITRIENNLYRGFLRRKTKKGLVGGFFLLDSSVENKWILFSNDSAYFIDHVLESFFDKLYPFVSRVYFNYSEMKVFLNEIKDNYKGKTEYTKFTIKRIKKQTNLPSSLKKKKGTMILWEHNADEELFIQSKDYLLIVNRLNYNIRDNKTNMLLLRSSLSRKGKCTLEYGVFKDFYNNVILTTVNYGKNRTKFYNLRERIMINEKIELRPFTIQYPNKIDIYSIRGIPSKLINSYSTAIIHNGNPYFVATLSDYDEGSSFGITILGDVVTITPISKGSPEASWKLTEKIQEILGDGNIINVDVE